MRLVTQLQGRSYQFKSLADLFAKAGEEKSGDHLAGIAARCKQERVAAKSILAELTLGDIRNHPLIDPDTDEVARIIENDLDDTVFQAWAGQPVGAVREWLLDPQVSGPAILEAARGWNSDMIAAIAKLMSNLDLIWAAAKIEVLTRCRTTIGQRGTLASRLQPNHPSDHVPGMLASLYEGLSFGMGDAVIGINPVADTVPNTVKLLQATHEVITRWDIPTQNCVLAHLTTQMEAVRQGAPADMLFQSIGGTQAANTAFGIDAALLDDAYALLTAGSAAAYGPNRLYFETGQGSELSSNSHHGIDQMTLESRCYGFARHWRPFLVNSVVGFIGPEYLYDRQQVIRAGLEDHFMGKLHGLPMGVDVCYTNHMQADQNDIENLAVLLTSAGTNFVIAVPMGDDCMLNYQSLSYHDVATLRQTLNKPPAPEFAQWLAKMGFWQAGHTALTGDWRIFAREGAVR